jgi:hypothetical protein
MGSEQNEQIQVLVDLDIYDHLRSKSSFEDSFSSVLRRELGLEERKMEINNRDEAGGPGKSTPHRLKSARGSRKGKKSRRPRAAAGTLLPESEYHRPILESLADGGGRLPKQAVIEEIGRRLGDRFTDADRDTLESGGIRWQSRAQFARLRLADRGFIDKNAPRGIWAITEEGEKALEGAI